MLTRYPLADEAETEIGALKEKGVARLWLAADVSALLACFDRWISHPRFLDPQDRSLLRITVLNELTWLTDDPGIGDPAWQYLPGVAARLGTDDPHDLRSSLIVSTYELAAEPPEVPDFLAKLFSLAAHENTRWAVFGAYENVPWRLRPHARRYSHGTITDDDCDRWLIDQERGDDEVLMQRHPGSQARESDG